jgi:hypothetical protein
LLGIESGPAQQRNAFEVIARAAPGHGWWVLIAHLVSFVVGNAAVLPNMPRRRLLWRPW